MSYDDHDLCGSFCECGPEVTPMTATERAEYQAETARLRAANVARVQEDAVNLRAYDKAVRDALQALRDTDHAVALEVDRAATLIASGSHPAEPHSRRPTECRTCGRLIVGRFEDGTAISYTHREKASL